MFSPAKDDLTSSPSSHGAAERGAWWLGPSYLASKPGAVCAEDIAHKVLSLAYGRVCQARKYTDVDAWLCPGGVLCWSAPRGCTALVGVKSWSFSRNSLYKNLYAQIGLTRPSQ